MKNKFCLAIFLYAAFTTPAHAWSFGGGGGPIIPPGSIINDWQGAALDSTKRALSMAWQNMKDQWDKQVADAAAMADIRSEEQISNAKQTAINTRDSLNAQYKVIEDAKASSERCASSAGHGEAAAEAEVKKNVTLAHKNIHQFAGGGANKVQLMSQVANLNLDKYCDPTSALCRQAGKVTPKPTNRPNSTLANADMMASSLSSDDNTQTDDEHDAGAAYVNRITGIDKLPQALNEAQVNTPQAVQYETARGVYMAKTDIARSVFIEKLERQRANANNYDLLQSLNSNTEVVKKSLENGSKSFHGNKLSADELSRVFATMRADSPTWYKAMDQMTSVVPVYKEWAFSMAYDLKLQYQTYMQLRKHNILTAQKLLEKLDATYLPGLTNARAIAVANQPK